MNGGLDYFGDQPMILTSCEHSARNTQHKGTGMDQRIVDQGTELARRGLDLARELGMRGATQDNPSRGGISPDDPGELSSLLVFYQEGRVNRGLEPLPIAAAVKIATHRRHRTDQDHHGHVSPRDCDWKAMSYSASLSDDDVQEARERLGDKLADLLLAGFTQAEAGAALGMSARTIKRRFAAARNGERNNDCLDTAERMIGYGHDVLEAPKPLFVAVKNQSPMPPSHSSPMSKPITQEPITHRHNLTPESGSPCPAFCKWASANQYPVSIGL